MNQAADFAVSVHVSIKYGGNRGHDPNPIEKLLCVFLEVFSYPFQHHFPVKGSASGGMTAVAFLPLSHPKTGRRKSSREGCREWL